MRRTVSSCSGGNQPAPVDSHTSAPEKTGPKPTQFERMKPKRVCGAYRSLGGRRELGPSSCHLSCESAIVDGHIPSQVRLSDNS